MVDSNKGDGAGETQEIDQQLRNPAENIDDRHEDHHFGDAFPVALKSLLGSLCIMVLGEPKAMYHSTVENSHNANRNDASNHRPPNCIHVTIDWFGPAVRTSIDLLDVGGCKEARNSPEGGKRPAQHDQNSYLSVGEFSAVTVWIQHNAMSFNSYDDKRKHGRQRTNPTQIPRCQNLAENISGVSSWMSDCWSDDERNANKDGDHQVCGC